MFRTPAHKQTDPAKKPGQIVNKVKTLGDYVEKMVAAEAAPRKLTFDEWFETESGMSEYSRSIAYYGWKAAKENE